MTTPERRRHVDLHENVTDQILNRLEEGEKLFEEFRTDRTEMRGLLIEIKKGLDLNTVQTNKAVTNSTKALKIAEQTAEDTQHLVSIEKFGKSLANGVTIGARGASTLTKIIVRVVVIGSIVGMIWHGKWPDWKTVIEALK